jgi:hypothetical protein
MTKILATREQPLDVIPLHGIISATKRVCYLSDGSTDGGWDQPHADRAMKTCRTTAG